MNRAAAVMTLAFLGACSVAQPDPCASFAATMSCITVVVSGEGSVDALDVVASGAFSGDEQSLFKKASALPVRFAVTPVANSSGDLTLTITGTLRGTFVGVGSGTLTGIAGDPYRRTLDVELGGAAPGNDAAMNIDGSMSDLPTCTASSVIGCSSDMQSLLSCDASGNMLSTPCSLGCSTQGTPHCMQLAPHAPVSAPILAAAANGVITLENSVIVNTDTGAISGYRAANDVAGTLQTISGISFQTIDAASSVFTLNSLTISESANVVVTGTRPWVVAAGNVIVVHGVVDARPYSVGATPALCPIVPNPQQTAGPYAGGGSGAVNLTPTPASPSVGSGLGGGSSPAIMELNGPGGGGGANATKANAGGNGDNGTAVHVGGAGGGEVAFGTPIVGGSGGGAGSGSEEGSAQGGAGGGAVHFVALTSITIGGGLNVSPMGIMVNGCGGAGGIMENSGCGGGSGGTVLLESPTVSFGAYGAIVAHGGGGGSYMSSNISTTSGFTANPIAAATGMSGYANGGIGGGGANLAGAAGASAPTTSAGAGGGAGGTAGRIIILNSAGTVSLDTNGFFSPQTGLMGTNADPAVLLGKITTQ